jgi:flagellar hook protein FlgE
MTEGCAKAQKGLEMLGSMYSAVSGLSAHQMKMNVIGNNIANVNTYGFKSSRVTFSDIFYQTISGASTPGTSTGGTNPIQLGYGAQVKSIDVINTRAGSATTDRPLDVYINGEGYLPVKDSNGIIKYTRVGVLSFDVSGNLVDSSGNMVLGIAMDPNTKMAKLGSNGTVSAKDLVPIKVDPKDMDKFTGIAIGSNGEITAIKEGDPIVVPAANTGWLLTAGVTPASLYSGNIVMTATRGSEVGFISGTYKGTSPEVSIFAGNNPVSNNADANGDLKVRYDGTDYHLSYTRIGQTSPIEVKGVVTPGTAPNPDTVTFNVASTDGNPATVTIPVSQNNADIGIAAIIDNDDVPVSIGSAVASEIKISATTYDKAGSEVKLAATWKPGAGTDTRIILGDITLTLDPSKFGALQAGELNNAVIGSVEPGAGEPIKIANIAIVKFTNSDGLSQSGEGYYVETGNSGQPVGTIPGNGGTGTFRAGALEMSNVDLSREFTEMIIAQRGFQANTRMITVSDEMLSELVNMKR